MCPGPGFTNVLTSIANASVDRTAVIYIVGSAPLGAQLTNGLQVGLDHVAVAKQVAKWAARVDSLGSLQRMVEQAARVATTAPCGPVLLDIPADVLDAQAFGRVDDDNTNDQVHGRLSRAGLASADVTRCLDLIRDARRPALMIGHTPSTSARAAIAEFVTRTTIPCFLGYGSLGSVADAHPSFGGTLFQLGRLGETEQPDLLLAVGAQFGFETPGLRDGGTGWGTAVVHIDGDPAEIHRFAPAKLGLVADPDAALIALADHSSGVHLGVDPAWVSTVRASRSRSRDSFESVAAGHRGRVHPYAAGRVVSDVAAASGAWIVGDGAICKHGLLDALQLDLGGRYFTHGRFGCMGTGLGLAIGATVAEPTQRVVCVTGDGAVGFTLGEFETIVRRRLPITVVVMNNARWGASQGFQLRPGGPQRVVGTTLPDADSTRHDGLRWAGHEGRQHRRSARPAVGSSPRRRTYLHQRGNRQRRPCARDGPVPLTRHFRRPHVSCGRCSYRRGSYCRGRAPGATGQ